MVTFHFFPDILSSIFTFPVWNFTQMIEIKLDDFSEFFSESGAAQASATRINH